MLKCDSTVGSKNTCKSNFELRLSIYSWKDCYDSCINKTRIQFYKLYSGHEHFRDTIPFPHIGTFWRLCSRRLFENIVTKEEIAQNVQFLLLPQCLPLFVTGDPLNYGDFLCVDKMRSKSSAAELLYEGKGYITCNIVSLTLSTFNKTKVLLCIHFCWFAGHGGANKRQGYWNRTHSSHHEHWMWLMEFHFTIPHQWACGQCF